jgi:hypothetical protein
VTKIAPPVKFEVVRGTWPANAEHGDRNGRGKKTTPEMKAALVEQWIRKRKGRTTLVKQLNGQF